MSNELPFKLPIKFVKECGMFFDANDDHIADIRGWGHLQYKGNPEALQDLSGEKIAEAINNYYGKKSLDESHTCLLGCQCSKHFTNPNKENVLIEALETIIRSTECCKEDLIIQDIRKQAEQAIAKYKEN